MYTLITLATQWGSKYGGINSFNADFLTAFGFAYHHSAQIVCVVAECSPEAKEEAAKAHVKLVSLPYPPKARAFDSSIGEAAVSLIKNCNLSFDPQETIWLGHDLISGAAAVAAASLAGGRSAVIHHMSYDDYESYAEGSESARSKTETQSFIFENADIVLAIGPLLRDAAMDRLGGSKSVHMLIPGLPEIDSKEAPKTFTAFLSGRLTADASRIKQGNLGIAGFATAAGRASDDDGPDILRRRPKLILRGVDFDNRLSESSLKAEHDPETELKDFADQYGGRVINLHALPYTEDRQKLYAELSGSSVALMPSWHEGFGLVGWEAIAAGVPLILGQNTGVYRLLEEEYTGAEEGYVYSIDVKGQTTFPYFRAEDLEDLATALRQVAADPAKARKKAGTLRNMLLEKNTWASCSERAAEAFGWDMQRGSLADRTNQIIQEITTPTHITAEPSAADLGPLKIPQKQWRPEAGMADSQLLRAEEALLPFDVRRQPEVEKLKTWIDDPTWPITVRLITGAGGEGKTRLAIHICEQLSDQGWHAGFLDSNLEPNQMQGLWRKLRELKQPVMIVVDYAETRQAAFLSLLKSALENPADKSIRMLLLARDGGEWWDNLPSRDPRCEALLSGYATTGPFRLSPLYAEQDDRRQAFAKALNAFADILHVKNPEVVPDLVGDQFERPLFIQMAALLTLYGERPVTTQGLTKALLNHERRYWVGLLASFNWPDPGRRAEQLLALATLAGGIPISRVGESLWKAAKGTALTTGEFNSLFRNMATLYPGTTGLQALRPDLLGEALVAQALLRAEGDVLLDAVLSSSAPQSVRRNALTVLARLSNERADVHEILVTGLSRQFANCATEVVAVSIETVSRLPEIAELAFERLSSGMKSQLAGLLRQFHPEESLQLARLGCSIYGHLYEKAHERLNQKPANLERLIEYGMSAYNYAIALSTIGAYKNAYEVNEEGLHIFERVITKDRNRHEPMYAKTLSSHADYLHEIGQINDALSYSREELEICNRLARKNPDRFEPDYATSLSNHAIYLRDVGQHDEALAHTQKALEIRKRLAYKNPDLFEPDYATSLNNYAISLTDEGHYKESLEHASEALEIRKQLRQKKPDRFEPNYAASLSTCAYSLSGLGQCEKALTKGREALEIRRLLAQKNPDRFEPDYANSLTNHAGYLSEVGKYDEALVLAREALVIRRGAAKKEPKPVLERLVMNLCLVHLFNWLCDGKASTDEDSLEECWSIMSLDEQRLMQLFSEFVEAIIADENRSRADCFRSVLTLWKDLSVKRRQWVGSYRLCAAAWSTKFDSLTESDWVVDWRNYLRKRNGHIPEWMLEVARRLGFQFPEGSELS